MWAMLLLGVWFCVRGTILLVRGDFGAPFERATNLHNARVVLLLGIVLVVPAILNACGLVKSKRSGDGPGR
jgi:hypothetical protein